MANARYVDFLITLALGMDANRNYEHYVKEDASKIDDFLGARVAGGSDGQLHGGTQ